MAEAASQHLTRAWYMRPPAWILGAVLVALAVFGILEMTSGPAALSYSDFLDQLDAGNIGGVTFAGTQIDGKFKTPQAAASATAPQTAFRSEAPTFGDATLLPELRKQHVSINVVSSSSWVSWLGKLPWPIVLIIGGALIAGLVRLVRGDKATVGSTMPTHPMIGLITDLFGKKDQVATHPAGKAPPAV